MSVDFTSVDEFVATYLANLEQQQQQQALVADGLPFGGANGLQLVDYHHPGNAAGLQQQQQQQQRPTPVPTTAPPVVKCETQGDVYMQPVDQMCYQNQFMQQPAAWQEQQLQLQQQHHAHPPQPADLQAAATTTSAAAAAAGRPTAAKAAGTRPSTGSSSNKAAQAEVSTSATGKRSSRSKSSSTRGRKATQPDAASTLAAGEPQLKAELQDAGSFAVPNLGHSMSAPPQAGNPAAFSAAQLVLGPNSFSAYGQAGPAYGLPGNLSSVLLLQQQAQAAGSRQQQQQQRAGGAQALQVQDADEPDMSHMTVMQRYHARRKLAVQRMEREVEEKIAQLAVLEQENRQLKWQAHILENMLLDIDKQVELMSSEELPDASQWLTLLGMGTSAAAGSSGHITRTLHKMLEGAAAVDLTGWTADTCRRKWLAFLEQLQPLVQQAEAAQAAYKAAQGSSGDHDGDVLQPQRRPQRAAAAAAVAVIKQEAADVLGVAPLPVCPVASNIPDVPVAQQHHAGLSSSHASTQKSPNSSSSPVTQPGAGGEEPSAGASIAQPMEGVNQGQQQQAPVSSSCSPHGPLSAAAAAAAAASEHSVGSMTGSEISHGPNVEGIPAAVLARIEDLVMINFYWLLAIMTRNPLLTYEFISTDLVEGRTPLPPQHDKMWGEALNRIELTLEQKQECCTCLQVSRRCMEKVVQERAQITAAMQPAGGSIQTGPQTQAWMSEDFLVQNQVDQMVERMRANVRKESVVRNLVGFYCINVISLYQLAQLSLSCSPWFCMAWRVAGAVEEQLNRQLAGEAALQQHGSGHATRSSTRLAAQR